MELTGLLSSGGGYNALLLLIANFLGWNNKYAQLNDKKSTYTVYNYVGMLLTFMFVVFGWIIFRSLSLSQAYHYIVAIFSNSNLVSANHISNTCMTGIVMMIIIEWAQRSKDHAFQLSNSGLMRYRPIRWFFYYGMAILTYTMSGLSQDFIYFQF